MNFSIICLITLLSFAKTDIKDNPLLKIGRSVDKNEVHYFLNIDSKGELSKDEPIKLLWKNGQKGSYETINWIKKKYGYGLVFDKSSRESIAFQFVSYKKKWFYLKKNNDGKFAIFSNFDQGSVELKEVFVNIQGGSFWTPRVTSVELKGTEEKSRLPFQYTLIP
jgi:hypothetical protein